MARRGQCLTCQNPEREVIDQLLREGFSPTRVAWEAWRDEPMAATRIRDHRRFGHHEQPADVVLSKSPALAAEDEPAPRLLQPLAITVTPAAPRPVPARTLRRAVVWPDIQAGFKRDMRTGALEPIHDRAALDVAVQITNHVQPDRIVYLGDNLDLPDWSLKYLRAPEFYWTTQAAAVELAWWIAQCQAAVKNYLEGNHERRLSVAIEANLIAAYGLRPALDLGGPPLLSVERLLGLDELGVCYNGPYPAGEVWLNDNLRLVHGEAVRAGSGDTVRAVVDDLRHSEMQGHIHRLEMASKTAWTIRGAKVYHSFSPGTLCRLTPGLVPGSKHRQNWQQGIAVIDYEDGGEHDFHVNLVPIYEGYALFDGRRWEARPEADIVRAIEADTSFKVA